MLFSPVDITSNLIQQIVAELERRYGVNFMGYNRNFLRRRIASRINRLGLKSPNDYFEILVESASEFSNLLQNLTINTSEFMRNPEVFTQLERKIFPRLMNDNGAKQIRIWSAGCSRGQEPYSIAIIMLKLGIPTNTHTTIVATDIDEVALSIAKKGIYRADDLKNLSPTDRRIFFKKISDDEYSVSKDVRKLVLFRRHDVVDGPSLGCFNVIVCRNVSIYFTKPLQERMYHRFYDDLHRGGYLVIGKTEMPPTRFSRDFVVVDFENRIYQKVS